MIPIGRDKFGRGVVYGCPARASDADGEQTLHHVCATLEAVFARGDALAAEALAKLDGAKGGSGAGGAGGEGEHAALAPSTWVWMVDFAGFGLVHATNPSIATRLVSAFSSRFPERLGAVVLIDAPWIFQILLGAIRPFVDEVTLGKVVTTSRHAPDFRAQLDSMLDPELADWLERACRHEPAAPGSLIPVPDRGIKEHDVLRGFLRARGAPLPPSEPADAHGDPGPDHAPWRHADKLSHGQAWELYLRAYDFDLERVKHEHRG
jgi:CRAL/TRIO domain